MSACQKILPPLSLVALLLETRETSLSFKWKRLAIFHQNRQETLICNVYTRAAAYFNYQLIGLLFSWLIILFFVYRTSVWSSEVLEFVCLRRSEVEFARKFSFAFNLFSKFWDNAVRDGKFLFFLRLPTEKEKFCRVFHYPLTKDLSAKM